MVKERTTARQPAAVYLGLIFLGIALTMVARWFDGFVSGLFQGMGIALILGGVAVGGAHWRRAKHLDEDGGAWLPSRDGDG